MLNLLQNLRLVYRDHVEFRVLCWLFLGVGLIVGVLDVCYAPSPRDVLIEAHGTLIDLLVVGILGAVFLYFRFRPIASMAYAQMLRAAAGCTDYYGQRSSHDWAYRFGDHWVIAARYNAGMPAPRISDAWPTEVLIDHARREREVLERLKDSPPATRDPEIGAALLGLIEALVHVEQYLPSFGDAGREGSVSMRERVVNRAHWLATTVAARADESIPTTQLRERYEALMRKEGANGAG